MSKKAHICMNIGSLTSETIIEALSKKLDQMDKQVRVLENIIESDHISLRQEMDRNRELLKQNDSLRHELLGALKSNDVLREENNNMRFGGARKLDTVSN